MLKAIVILSALVVPALSYAQQPPQNVWSDPNYQPPKSVWSKSEPATTEERVEQSEQSATAE
jgi:hypothetical protein